MERERRFGALVSVRGGLSEPIAAAAGGKVVERNAKTVTTEEPVERRLRARSVIRVAGDRECGELRFDECTSVDRLLVARARRRLVAVAAQMPGQPQGAFTEARFVAQPAKRFQSDRH